MSPVTTIIRIAHAEALVSARSWLFRFCALFTFIGLGAANVYFFIPFEGPLVASWWVRSVPSSVPYFNVLVLTVVESLVVMFRAVDSMNREFSFDTSDSLHVRNISNLHYIAGKALGLIVPVVILNVVFLTAVFVVNSVFMLDVPLVWQAYILYPLLINLPALVFVIGLSFTAMNLVRHTPFVMMGLLMILLVPFVVSSGYIARSLDYSAMHLPMLYSDFVGFGNFDEILLQRGSILLLGLGLIALSSVTFRRVPQSRPAQFAAMTSGVVSVVVSVSLAATFLSSIATDAHLRARMRTLNEEYVQRPRVRMTACHLDMEHHGRKLVTQANITIENPTDSPLNRVCFSLNPGYDIEQVTTDGQPLQYSRDTQILDITLASPLQPGESRALRISYHGTTDDCAAYPDIDEDQHQRLHRLFTYVIDKRHGFVTPDYLLLTPESLWYPSPGIPYGEVFPDAYQKDFVDFSFELTTDPALTVITQGDVVHTGDGRFQTVADSKLTGLTLVAGDYEERAVDVDSVAIKLFTKPGHDYFAEYFEGCEDMVIEKLHSYKDDLELSQGMSYPYSRFLLVETPVQFYAYERPWLTYTDTVQPQMDLLPERGSFFINGVEFGSLTAFFEQSTHPDGREYDNEAIAAELLRYFYSLNIENDTMAAAQSRTSRAIPRPFSFQPSSWTLPFYNPRYSMDAQFYPFIQSFEFEDYPICNSIMELYNKHGMQVGGSMTERYSVALVEEERACLALGKQSFLDYVRSGIDYNTTESILKLKAKQLVSLLGEDREDDEIKSLFNYFRENHACEQVSFIRFEKKVHEQYGNENIAGIFNEWQTETRLPFFEFPEMSLTELTDGERPLYQLSFVVTNTQPVIGIVSFQTWTQGSEVRNTVYRKNVLVEGNQSKEVGFVFDEKVQYAYINTIVSKNLPIMYRVTFSSKPAPENTKPFDGVRSIPYRPIQENPGHVVVDNLDEGFQILRDPPEKEDHLDFQFGQNPGGYVRCIPDRPPSRWGKAVFHHGYGKLHTAYYTRCGPGDGEVCWTANIPETGQYELEYFFPDITGGFTWRVPKDDPDFGKPRFGDYHVYVVAHGKREPIIFQPVENSGWQYVATFDLEPGPVEVHLTNESNGRCIYADAIRWVKKNSAQTSQLITF